MRNFGKTLLFLAAAGSLGLASCSDESPWSGSDSEGAINLNFSTDGRVMRQTRADDGVSPVVPDGNRFAVSLVKADGSYSKNWTGVEAFNREKSFPMGDYALTATYGDLDTEGFDNPYYKGSADVHVSPGVENPVSVVATLANAMVSIRYTTQFMDNFSAYSASVQTEGHDWVVFAQNETRPAYIAPSEVKLNLTLTNEQGERVTIEPASFTAVARHHYVVTIGVEGDAANGGLSLNVVFDDDVVAETVNVTLGDELFSAPAPTVTPKGFTPGTPYTGFTYSSPADQMEFHVFAFGGLKSATLNVVSDNGFSPAFGRTVELVNADALTQQQLASAGVVASGFFRNVDKMGVVNLSKFIELLPAGKYEVELHAVDAMTRASEPVKMSIELQAVELGFAAAQQSAEFMASEITVDITTNCSDVKDKLRFQAPDAQNRMVEAPVKSVTDVTASGKRTRAAGTFTYRYVLGIAPMPRAEIDVKVMIGNEMRETKITMADPEYTITPDAFARKVVLKIEGKDEAQTKQIRNRLTFYNNDVAVPTVNVSHDDASGLITISGLTPGTRYENMEAAYETARTAIPAFTTETEAQVPNGNFSATSQTLNIPSIDAGGKYKYLRGTYQNTSSIQVDEPNGWASVNAKTCYDASANKNTWFMVPSTMSQNGSVLIRSVAYDHNGASPALDDHGILIRDRYSRNAPASFAAKASGELFLGSYSYSGGVETRDEGVAFNSRPISVLFDYRYVPVSGETGLMTVAVVDASGHVLASGSVDLTASESTSTRTVALNYSSADFGKKASSLRVGFKSTKNQSVNVPVPSDLADVSSTSARNHSIAANQYKSLCVGSQLWVSNVRLGYTDQATRSKGKRRK